MGLQLSGSVQLEGNLLVTGSANSVFENISVTNRITANEINVQFVSSSIIYSSGSNKFGDEITDNHQFTGSVDVSGSLTVNGILTSGTVSGSTNYVGKFTGTNTIGNSQIFDDGARVFINATTAPSLGSPKLFVKMVTANTYEGILVASSTNNNVIAIAHTGTQGIITTNYGTGGANTPLAFGTDGAAQMTLSTLGNLGLGVTPSAGWVQGKALEVGFVGTSLWGRYANESHLTMNYYYSTSANARLYASTDPASDYEQFNGNHTWYSAPSGTANTAINFTSSMSLTAAGRLGLGYTTPQDFTNASGYGQFVIGPIDGNVTGMTIYSTQTNGIMFADATSGPGAYAGYLVYTHATDKLEIATSSTPRLTLDASGSTFSTSNVSITDGNLVIGTAGKGIDFSATSNGSGTTTSELLNDYEEGTWTGTMIGTVTDPTTPVTATGTYTKIGRQVTAQIAFVAVDTTGAAGGVRVTGLPFATSGLYVGSVILEFFDFTAGRTSAACYTNNGTPTAIFIEASGDDTAFGGVAHAAGTGRYLYATLTYFV